MKRVVGLILENGQHENVRNISYYTSDQRKGRLGS